LEVVGAAFFTLLELESMDSPSVGPCLGTYLGETFRLETVFVEGGVCLELGSAGALLLPLAGA